MSESIEYANCEVCGGNVAVEGEHTLHYRNLDFEEIDQLKADLKKAEDKINRQRVYIREMELKVWK